MDNAKLYQYTGEERGGILTGAMVVYVADTPNPGLVHVRDTTTQKTAMLPRKDLKETKVLNNDMQAASDLAAVQEGFNEALANARAVSVSYVDATGIAHSAIYAMDDTGRIKIVNAQLFEAYQLLQYMAAQPQTKNSAGIAAPAIIVAGHLVGKVLDTLEHTEPSVVH